MAKERGFLIDFVGWMFSDMIKYILFTPFNMFATGATISLVIKFSIVAGAFVTILTMIEGFKRMASAQYTPIGQIMMRYPIALAVSGFAPILFYGMGMGANGLVELIGHIADTTVHSPEIFKSRFAELGSSIYLSFLTFFFLIALCFYMFVAFLKHAKRWFGLLFNCVTTPLVMLSYMFNSYNHIAVEWFKDTMDKFKTQVVHSLFLSIIMVILYAPNMILPGSGADGMNHGLVRIMLAVGGLHMMIFPPAWVKGIKQTMDPSKLIGVGVKIGKALLTKGGK